MYYHIETQNLMTVPQGYTLAHCISADCALGAGVAKQIDEAYSMRETLKKGAEQIKGGIPWPSCVGVSNVMNLVTKGRCFHKPTLDALREALKHMRKAVETYNIKKIAMPKIGCGLDRLDWEDVEPMIHEIFDDLDIEIMVCVLPD